MCHVFDSHNMFVKGVNYYHLHERQNLRFLSFDLEKFVLNCIFDVDKSTHLFVAQCINRRILTAVTYYLIWWPSISNHFI